MCLCVRTVFEFKVASRIYRVHFSHIDVVTNTIAPYNVWHSRLEAEESTVNQTGERDSKQKHVAK